MYLDTYMYTYIYVHRCVDSGLVFTVTHCRAQQHSATHCSTLLHTAAHYSTLQHTCNTLQHTEKLTLPSLGTAVSQDASKGRNTNVPVINTAAVCPTIDEEEATLLVKFRLCAMPPRHRHMTSVTSYT